MRARGYTLIELLIAVTISLLGVAAGMTLLIGTQHWFQSGVDDRGLQETARIALEELTGHVRQAGYGLEPNMVFDMGILHATVMSRVPPENQSQVRFGGYAAGPRDRDDGPDELVFYTRDRAWSRDVTAVDAATGALTLAAPASVDPDQLLPGQVLQLLCYGKDNEWFWAFVTVEAAQVQASGEVDVTLEASPGQPLDFPFQNTLLSQSCFGAPSPPPTPTVRAFKIDRYRYHVAAIEDDGSVVPWGTAGARPYLMLEQGLRDEDDNLIDRAVAPDVEDLQVAYVFPLAPPGRQVLGATPGQQVLANTGGVDDNAFNLNPQVPFVIPSFATAPIDLDLARTSHHPANIRALRIAVTVRTARRDIGITDATVPPALNRDEVDGEAGYRRMTFETTANTRNLEARSPVFPVYDPQSYLTDCKAAGCAVEPCPRATAGNCGGG